MTYVIGRDAVDNTRLVLESAGYDVWLHLKDTPSPHLIFRNPEALPLDTLRRNGTIYSMSIKLKKHSKFRSHAHVEIIYCYVNNLKTTETPGLIHTLNKPSVIIA